MTTKVVEACSECGSSRPDSSVVCPACGAPPIREGEHRAEDEEVRADDLEPYITLRYIARLFKVLAVLALVVLIAEVILGVMAQGVGSIFTLLVESMRLFVIGGLMWALGDITLLIIDAGHDLRVARILLGRINAELHKRGDSQKS